MGMQKAKYNYDKDFSHWAYAQANFLKKGDFEKLDLEHLIEEIEDLGKRERDKLRSYLETLLMHMLKIQVQPEMHTRSWDLSIKEAMFKADECLSENPSLKSQIKVIVKNAYIYARLKAARETNLPENKFPKKCPWKLKEIFPKLEKKYQ